jgi:LacI family transcriptional regulator
MFCNTDESEAEEMASLHMLIERQIDGILLVPVGSSPEPLRMLKTHGVPVVVLDRRAASAGVDQVRSDSEEGAYLLVRHLLELGHRRIALLTGRRNISTSADRIAGYRRALAAAGVPYDARIVRDAGYSTEAGYTMACDVLGMTPRPTAIFAANNFIAFGAIPAIHERGLAVPDDVSVVCFDDVPPAWLVDPFLTCIEQDAYGMGRLAAELVLTRLASSRPVRRRSIVLPVRLVVRRSSAPPAAIDPSAIPA